MLSHSPGAGLLGGGVAEGYIYIIIFLVAKLRTEDGVCAEWPLRSSKELLARD